MREMERHRQRKREREREREELLGIKWETEWDVDMEI